MALSDPISSSTHHGFKVSAQYGYTTSGQYGDMDATPMDSSGNGMVEEEKQMQPYELPNIDPLGDEIIPVNTTNNTIITRQYVPLSLAETKIQLLQQQLSTVKHKHLTIVDSIIEKYEKLHTDSRQGYESVLRDVKTKATIRLQENQQLIDSLQQQIRLLQERQSQQQAFTSSRESLEHEKQELAEKLQFVSSELDTLQQRHELINEKLNEKKQQLKELGAGTVGKDEHATLQQQSAALQQETQQLNTQLLMLQQEKALLDPQIDRIYQQTQKYSSLVQPPLEPAATTDEKLQHVQQLLIALDTQYEQLQRQQTDALYMSQAERQAAIRDHQLKLKMELNDEGLSDERRAEIQLQLQVNQQKLQEYDQGRGSVVNPRPATAATQAPTATSVVADEALVQHVRHLEAELNDKLKQNYKLQKQLLSLNGDANGDNDAVSEEQKQQLLQYIADSEQQLNHLHNANADHSSSMLSLQQQIEQLLAQLRLTAYPLDAQMVDDLTYTYNEDTDLQNQRATLAQRVAQLKQDKQQLTDLKQHMLQLKEQIQTLKAATEAGEDHAQQIADNEQQYSEVKTQAQSLANELKVNYSQHEQNLSEFKQRELQLSTDYLQRYELGTETEGDNKFRKLQANERDELRQLLELYHQLQALEQQHSQNSQHQQSVEQQLHEHRSQYEQLSAASSGPKPQAIEPVKLVEPYDFSAVRTSTSGNPVVVSNDAELQSRYTDIQQQLHNKDNDLLSLQANSEAQHQQQQHMIDQHTHTISELQQQLHNIQLADTDERTMALNAQLKEERHQHTEQHTAMVDREQQLLNELNAFKLQLQQKEQMIDQLRQESTLLRAGLPAGQASDAAFSAGSADDEEQQFKSLRAELRKLKQQISELEEEIESVRSEVSKKDEDIKHSKQMLVQAAASQEEEQQVIQEQISKAESQLQTEQQQILALKQQLSTVKNEREALATVVNNLQSSLQTLQSTANQRQGELLEQINVEYQQKQQQATVHHQQRLNDVQLQIQQLQNEMDGEKQKTTQFQTSIQNESAQRTQLSLQITNTQQQSQALEDLAANATTKMNDLKDNIAYNEQILVERNAETVELTTKSGNLTETLSELDVRFKEEQKRRKEFQIKYEDAKGKVRVYSRVRPFNRAEVAAKEATLLRPGMNDWTLELNETERDVMGNLSDKWRDYTFDHVFQFGLEGTKGNASQLEVFNECCDFADLSANGINTCIFAYGQSGTGKTFTMAGIKPPPENPSDRSLLGLKPRMIEYVYQIAAENSRTHEYKISCYLVEIYLNQLEDVLFKWQTAQQYKGRPKKEWPAPGELKVRVDANKRVTIDGIAVMEFPTGAEMSRVMDECEDLRRTRKTGLNEASSRSHLVFTMLIQSTEKATGKTMRGKMSLVDLAGSERADKTNVEGLTKQQREAMLEEGIAINESLRMLKNVFRILGSAHLPMKKGQKPEIVQYRGNMLTELMQDSLGGNAKTLMFVNVGPAASNISETQDSLGYGDYVKNIINEKATAEVDQAEQVRVLRQKLMQLEEKYGPV